MSYSNVNVEITYDGNGSDDSFGVNFYYLEGVTASIVAELWDYTDPDLPVKQSFVLGVDYTIDESNYPNTLVNTAVPVAVDFKLIMYRQSIPIQTTSFVNGAFPAESVEEGLDKVMMATQEQYAKTDRAILNPIGGPTIEAADLIEAAANIEDFNARISDNEDAISDIYTTQLPSKEGTITVSTADKYYRGDKTFADFNPAVLASLLSGFTSGAGAVLATDTIIQALQKLDGNTLAVSNTVSNKPDDWVVTSEALSGTYSVGHREIHIAKSSVQTINLPAPQNGLLCKVKMAGNYANVTVQSVAGIDGFGTSYTLSSIYESVSFVSDGTQWYII